MTFFRRLQLLFILIIFFWGCRFAEAAKSIKLSIPKEQPLVVEVPPHFWEKAGVHLVFAKGTADVTGEIPISTVKINKDFIEKRAWEDGQLPLLAEFHIEKAQECNGFPRIVECPQDWKQVELRSEKAWLKLQFPPEISDIEGAIKQIAFEGTVAQFESSNYLHEKVFLPNQEKMFAALPRLSEDDRYNLFKIGLANGYSIASETFKGRGYVTIVVPVTATYNTLRVSQEQRISLAIREMILPEAKTFLTYADEKAVDGLAFFLSIPSSNFVTGGEAKLDNLSVYLPTDALGRFSNSDISSQKLIDESIVLLNNDRIEVKTTFVN